MAGRHRAVETKVMSNGEVLDKKEEDGSELAKKEKSDARVSLSERKNSFSNSNVPSAVQNFNNASANYE